MISAHNRWCNSSRDHAPERAGLIVLQNDVDKAVIPHCKIANAPEIGDQLLLFNKLLVFNAQSIKGARLQTSND